jgi:hypothetical protein
MSTEGNDTKVNDLKPVKTKKIKPSYKSSKHRLVLKHHNSKKARLVVLAVITILVGYLVYSSPLFVTLRIVNRLQDKKLLVGFQNSAELRPTGGFWGSFGIWQTHRNALDSTLYFETNPYKKDNPLLAKSSEALPKPMAETFQDRPQSFVNANWQVDFPDAARSLEWYLAEGWNERVDGTIAISSLAVIDLLRETGPIEIDNTRISADNFTEVMSQKIDVEYWQSPENHTTNEPKTILKNLAPTLISESKKLGFFKLRKFYLSQIRKGRIIVYFSDKKMESLARKLKASGEIKSAPKDYLQINNANLNGGKSSLNVEQSINYQVRATDHYISDLTIERKVNNQWPNILNRNYTRVFVPLGSVLISAKLNDKDITGGIDIGQEKSHTVFGFWFSVGPGFKEQIKLTYQLPFEKNRLSKYSLLYQKQPGTLPESLTISTQGGESFSTKIDQLMTQFKTGIK